MTASDPAGLAVRPKRLRSRTWSAVLVILALLFSIIVPIPAATAAEFSDVAGNSHETAITALADSGVLDGTECGTGRFCPDDPIERWVMAVWLVRVLGGDVTSGGTSRFADVDSSAWWSPFTEQLAIRNITAGCRTGPLRYCPQDAVTRGQMATFLVRAFDLAPAAPAGFVDTGGNTHETNINALAAAGITAGCRTSPLSYCPQNAVTRGQMASFLHRASLKQQATAAEISDDVPNIELTDLASGATVNLRSLISGDTAILLWFWAEW